MCCHERAIGDSCQESGFLHHSRGMASAAYQWQRSLFHATSWDVVDLAGDKGYR